MLRKCITLGICMLFLGTSIISVSSNLCEDRHDLGGNSVGSYRPSRILEVMKLTASDPALYEYFGDSVALDDTLAVIGASGDGNTGTVPPDGPGAAYIFRFDETTWVEEAKLTASNPIEDSRFGWSVALDDNVAIIGCPGSSAWSFHNGSAYVFRLNGTKWVEEAILTASDGEWHDHFGYSVALGGDVAVIGAYGNDDVSPDDVYCDSGSAYVFRYDGNTWYEEAKFTAFDAYRHDLFGKSVSISNDVIVIGALSDNDLGADSGSAYVYRYDGFSWELDDKLTASDGKPDAYFGFSVRVKDDIALIGAVGDNHAGFNAGASYVFRYTGSTWGEEAKLIASDALPGDEMGRSGSIGDNIVLVGAPACLTDVGTVYLYRNTGSTWVETGSIEASDGDFIDRFGWSISLSGRNALISSPYDDDVCPAWNLTCQSGAAYLYTGFESALVRNPTHLPFS